MKKIFAIFMVAMFALSFSAPNAEAADWGKILGDVFGSGGSSGGGSSTKVVRLAGKITDRNSVPLEGILVTYSVNGGGQKSVKTNSNGNYVLSVYDRVGCQLILQGETWKTQIYNFQPWGNEVKNFSMYHDYMTGKVINRNGVPIQGVKLVFEQDGSASGIQEVYTDANGNYKYILPDGGVYFWVTISKDGYQLQREHRKLYYEEIWNITMYQ